MSLYLLGPLIKQRREELGYSQEELADGICSVPTLSRIENGERLPNKQHSEMLLQRLGYSDSIIINYVDEKTLKLHELKYSIRHAVMCNQLRAARSETQGTVLCVVYSSTILRTIVRLTPVRREIWRRDRC